MYMFILFVRSVLIKMFSLVCMHGTLAYRTDRPTDRRTDGPTDRRTKFSKEFGVWPLIVVDWLAKTNYTRLQYIWELRLKIGPEIE